MSEEKNINNWFESNAESLTEKMYSEKEVKRLLIKLSKDLVKSKPKTALEIKKEELTNLLNKCFGFNKCFIQCAVSGWVSVSDELPKEHKFGMSLDVLTIAGSKMSVKSYDYELSRWNDSPHLTVTHWMEIPPFSPCH